MKHELPDLPFARDALQPQISPETLEYHHDKHHAAYVKNLNDLIVGTEFEEMSLEDIIRRSTGKIFNNAAQVWNHTFYWNCLSANGGGQPSGPLAEALTKQFGSLEKFQEEFTNTAATLFGSGWAWLSKQRDGTLEISQGSNAETPLRDGNTPVLTCDVWEHAYYIDYRNARPKYLASFWQLVNWSFAEEQFGK